LVYLGYVQKIKPQPVLAAKVVLFLRFVQQLPQSLVLAAIYHCTMNFFVTQHQELV
jgi:hypothetical protein